MFTVYGVKRGELVLWVGATSRPDSRARELRKRFGRDVTIFELERCENASKARARERAWIKKLKPAENKGAGGEAVYPKPTREKPARRARCEALTASGSRCRRAAVAGTRRCTIHPEHVRIRRDGRAAVNLHISAEGRSRLGELAAELGISRSELVERWIEERWRRRRNGSGRSDS